MATKNVRLVITEELHEQVVEQVKQSPLTMHDWIVEAIAEKANKDGKQRHAGAK